MVDVAAAADGDVVGEELEGDDFEDGEEELGGLGDVDDVCSTSWAMSVVAFDGDGDDAAGAGGDLLDVREGLFVLEDGGGSSGSFVAMQTTGQGLVDEGVGAVLHLAGGVAFGVDVGDLLELEGAFEGDGVVDAAAEEEEVAGGAEGLGELAALSIYGTQNLLNFSGDFRKLGDEVDGLFLGDGAAELGEVEGEDEEGGELGGEGLGGGDADLRAGVGGDGALGLAGDGGADDVADGEGFGTFGDEFALGGDGVGGLAGLGDEEADGAGVGDGIAVAVLAGIVDLGGEAGEALDHELAGEAGVPRGSAGGDGDLDGVAEVFGGDLHFLEEDLAGVERDAAEGGVADGAGLLVDLLEHEVLVAGLFGLDGVPQDALDFEGERVGVEVGEGDAGGGEDGDFAVGEEVDVAGVVEDAGDVGGEEEFAVAEADDGGRAHAGGDELVGLVGGEDADGEGPGDALDGAADGFFEGDGGWWRGW